ncbi:hypothetical protein CDL15_Pgr004941 [Punica granatum]|nr:hypothetical protein CDL15_Pgr004941 [Punica granatum]PKI70245.1 hypothetical protein CRG98_009377 [Punica granatum]
MEPSHFLLVTYPAQGHINPGLQFAKRLIRNGARVTFATSVSASRRMSKLPDSQGLHFAPFSDGYDDGFKQGDNIPQFLSELKRRGSESLRDLIASHANQGRPFTCLVYSLLLPWAADVARELNVPSALLWIQPATVLAIYHSYFYGYKDTIVESCSNDPNGSVELPGLPWKLTSRDLPSFLLPTNTYAFALPSFKEQLEALQKEPNPRILVNTFDALEPEALKGVEKYNLIGIGPLVPSAFLDGKDPSDTSFGGDLFQGTKDCKKWLDSQDEGSVIYISFGTLAEISKRQTEELACGLLASSRPFLWVVREKEKGAEGKEKSTEEEQVKAPEEEEELSCREELEKQGMIIPWCSQLEVLSHPSLGCFITHCGWNSTLESLVCGVPVVAFPQWTDQGTNAMLLENVWGTGTRVKANEEGIVDSNEIKRCLEVVLGERRKEMKGNALRWKELAREAVKEGGSSCMNLKAFMEDVSRGSHI